MKRTILCGVLLLLATSLAVAQKAAWRQATDAELSSLLPARAPVEKEHIETEMRTASGIVNGHGRFIAGVVLKMCIRDSSNIVCYYKSNR